MNTVLNFSYLISLCFFVNNLFLKCRYMDENGHSSSTNARAAHNIGRLGSIIRVLLLLLYGLF